MEKKHSKEWLSRRASVLAQEAKLKSDLSESSEKFEQNARTIATAAVVVLSSAVVGYLGYKAFAKKKPKEALEKPSKSSRIGKMLLNQSLRYGGEWAINQLKNGMTKNKLESDQ